MLISLLKPYIESNNNPIATYICGESYFVAVISRYLAPQASPAVVTKPKAVMSHMPFNINGRINLLFCFFWGVLAIVWLKLLYPAV